MAGIFDIGGGKSAKFENVGDRVQGTVESFKVSQQNKFDSVNWKPTNEPDFWPSGDPKMQVTIAVDTSKGPAPQRESEEDDGVRNVYATITSGEGTQFRAIQDAIKAAHGGVKADIEQGAFLDIWFSGYDPNSKNKQNPKKVYGAAYRKPVGAFGGQAPDQGGQPPQQQQQVQAENPWNPPAQQYGQQPQQAAPQYVQQGAPAGPPAQQYQQPQAAPAQAQFPGVDPAQQFGQPPYGQQPQAGYAQQPPAGPGPYQQSAPAQMQPQGGVDFAALAAQQQAGFGAPVPAPNPAGPAGMAPGQDDPNRAAQVQQAQAHFPNAQFQQPAPQAAAPAQQVVQPDMQRVQALISAQMDDATIQQATGISAEALNAYRNIGAAPVAAGMPQ